jgi:hypothetical protein
MSTQKVMTIEAVAETFSEGIPEWQKQANLNWLRMVHATLKDGGVWGSPALGTVYTKRGDGFILKEK